MKKILIAIIFGIVLLSLISANLGTFKINTCVPVKTVLNSSLVNISTLAYPNGSIALTDVNMTKTGLYTFIHSFCNTTELGTYIYDYYDEKGNVYANSFDITYTGFELNISNSILYLGLLALLIFLLIFILYSIPKIPKGNKTDEDNQILSVNSLKHLRPILYGVCWGIALAIIFIASNIALGFLTNSMMGKLFFMIYQVMFILTFPMILVWFVYFIKSVVYDRAIKKLIDRGVPVNDGGLI